MSSCFKVSSTAASVTVSHNRRAQKTGTELPFFLDLGVFVAIVDRKRSVLLSVSFFCMGSRAVHNHPVSSETSRQQVREARARKRRKSTFFESQTKNLLKLGP